MRPPCPFVPPGAASRRATRFRRNHAGAFAALALAAFAPLAGCAAAAGGPARAAHEPDAGRGAGFALANVAVSTPDPERLAAWYAEALDFRSAGRTRGVEGVELTMIEREGVVLDLIKVPNQRPLAAPADPPRHLETPGLRNLVFWVDDLKAYDRRLKSHGVRLVWESRYIEGIGTYNTAFHDPDGNLVALWQRRAGRAPGPAAPAGRDAAAGLRPHHAALSVADLDASERWYVEHLGFAVASRRDFPSIRTRAVNLERDGFQIELFAREGSSRPRPAADGGPPPEQLLVQGWGHVGFRVADVDATVAALARRGVRVASPPQDVEALGLRMAFVRDNGGNLVELAQPLGPRSAASPAARPEPARAGRGLASMAVFNTAVSVPDVDATVEWYRRVLGFREVSRTSLANGASFAMVERNGVIVEFLHVAGQRPPVAGMDADPPEHIKLPGVKNVCWWVDDMGAALAELDRHNVEYVWRARHLPEVGAIVTMIRDNNRNLITLWERRGAVWESLGRP